jgi:cell division protein FtsI (penicillin-binding protein 3)
MHNRDRESERKKMLVWGYGLIALSVLLFIGFIIRIVVLQNTNVHKFEAEYINKNYREATLLAARGNLYAADGSVLATTVMRYDVFIDFKTIKDSTYNNNASALADSLGKLFGKSKAYFKAKLDVQKSHKNQYFPLARNLDFDQFDRLRKFPIFKKGKNKGGFIVDRKYIREIATNQIGRGTIGFDNETAQSGFEGAFSQHLKGTNGQRLEQRINSSQWKPIDYWKATEPIDGKDVYATIDLRVQDIAHTALEHQLVKYNADHGCVLVMETQTGKIRAMVNLKKNSDNQYTDTYNYAVKDATEPGSTFKVISLLAAMDDGFVDENTKVQVNAEWEYAGQKITDHSSGLFDVSDVLAKSLNIGAAKMIVKNYAKDPQVFFNHLNKWQLNQKLDLEIPGGAKPFFVTPGNKRWNRATLASIAYGYSSRMSLLQLATFYNGVANGGKMLKPLFIDKIAKDGKATFVATPQVMVEKMASPEAIQNMTNALIKAVEKGTAKSIFTPNIKLAGKTGTARFEYWKPGPLKYQSSFAGFFPADNPKYTCVVMVNQPDKSIGFYGGEVAAPAFKEIAGKVFLKTPLNIKQEMMEDKKIDLNSLIQHRLPTLKIEHGQMPKLVHLPGKDVVAWLENEGYRVEYTGVGKVLSQFPTEGTIIGKKQKIYLTLQK